MKVRRKIDGFCLLVVMRRVGMGAAAPESDDLWAVRIAVSRAIAAARCMAAKEARISGFLALERSGCLLDFLAIPALSVQSPYCHIQPNISLCEPRRANRKISSPTFFVNEQQVGFDMAIPIPGPIPAQLMIAVPPFKR
jgi:hypothetical protein